MTSKHKALVCRRALDGGSSSSCTPQKRYRKNDDDDEKDAKKTKVGDNDGGHRSRSRKKKKEEISDLHNNKPKKRNTSSGRSHSFEDSNFERVTIEKHQLQRKQPIKKVLEKHYDERLNAPDDFIRKAAQSCQVYK